MSASIGFKFVEGDEKSLLSLSDEWIEDEMFEYDKMSADPSSRATQSQLWTELGVEDIDSGESAALTPERIESLVQHNVALLEHYICECMAYRAKKFEKLRLSCETKSCSNDSTSLKRYPDQDEAYSQFSSDGINDEVDGISFKNRRVDGNLSEKFSSFEQNPPTEIPMNEDQSSRSANLNTCNFLPGPAKNELVEFVRIIASMYRNVLYHNFEHASHVTASASRLVSMLSSSCSNLFCRNTKDELLQRRMSSCDTLGSNFSNATGCSIGSANKLHFYTFGLSSDPITHMAVVFTGLVHDVEHQGVGNAQLVREGSPIAVRYNDKSVAENNSLNVAFHILSEDKFSNLRDCMFQSASPVKGDAAQDCPELRKMQNQFLQEDQRRFRQVVIDLIMSTDISSQERLQIGKSKWLQAFENGLPQPEDVGQLFPTGQSATCPPNRKCSRRFTISHSSPSLPKHSHAYSLGIERALTLNGSTIEYYPGGPDGSYSSLDRLRTSSVLDQIIQAADVAHTMQAWPIFIKWNQKLYDELWAAKLCNRGFDCSGNWFSGQITFFDSYVLPLARRLQKCGVFGSFGNVFLDNATRNRARWIEDGVEVCKEMHKSAIEKLGETPTLVSDQ